MLVPTAVLQFSYMMVTKKGQFWNSLYLGLAKDQRKDFSILDSLAVWCCWKPGGPQEHKAFLLVLQASKGGPPPHYPHHMVCSDCQNKIPLTGGLNSRYLFSLSYGNWKSKIKVPAWLVPGILQSHQKLPPWVAECCYLAVSSHGRDRNLCCLLLIRSPLLLD